MALHDDAADPDAKDPVERESSRARCAISFAGPTDWSLLGEIEHEHPAYRQLLGYEPGTPAGEMSAEAMTDVSPISFASKDDPPVLLLHGDEDTVVPLAHAQKLDARLDEVGVPSELVIVEGGKHNVAGGVGEGVTDRAIEFAMKHIGAVKK